MPSGVQIPLPSYKNKMETLKKVLVNKGNFFYWFKGDLHTHLGVINEKKLENALNGKIVKSSKGEKFLVLDPNFTDKIRKVKRGPQVILPKDIGLIITTAGLNKESFVVDAGAGSLFMASSLSNFVKKVVSYENKLEFYKIAKENLKILGIKNMKLKKGDVYKSISERNVDLVMLDVPEPWRAVKNAEKALKYGGFLVAYNPSINQVKKFVESAKKESFLILKVSELIEREWFIEKHRQRPKTDIIGHTGFMTFARKL